MIDFGGVLNPHDTLRLDVTNDPIDGRERDATRALIRSSQAQNVTWKVDV